jgi:hypothetical protein
MPDVARAHYSDLNSRLELEATGVPGTVLLARHGEPVLQHCLGLADRAAGTPVTPATGFATASATKMLTAAAVLDQEVVAVRSYGYGVIVYPDGRFGHGGGDPGVSAMVNHWPDRDVTVVSLCNVEEDDERDPAVALRDAVLEAMPV